MTDKNRLPIIVREYLNDLSKNQGASADTIDNYSDDIYLFLRFLKQYRKSNNYQNIIIDQDDLSRIGKSFFSKLTDKEVKVFLAWLSDRGNSNSSKNRRISALKSLANFLIDEDILKIDIMRKIKSYKIKSREQDYLTEEESKKLLDVTEKNCKSLRDYLIINIYINMGLRRDELRELKISDIDLKAGELNIIGKGDKQRILKIPSLTIKIINEWLKERYDEYVLMDRVKKGYGDYLFLSNRGTILSESAIPAIINKYLKLANISEDRNIHTHSLRHSFISRIYDNTKDIKLASTVAGHSSIITTSRYIHQDKDKLDKAMEDFSL